MYIVLLCFMTRINSQEVVVNTSYGGVVGYEYDDYVTFFGVPYAEIDFENPFGQSLPLSEFKTPFIANDPNIMCPQIDGPEEGGTLECLCLNIYVPRSRNKKMPVLVWFHGDSFTHGKAGDYHSEHLLKEEIIFISVNFRLGLYGFLFLADDSVPGNQALRDQIQALRWIRNEIEVFNGDPNEVTIGGAGYGGGYVDLHLHTSINEKLFDKAIIQSGSAYSTDFFIKPTANTATMMSKYLRDGRRRRIEPSAILRLLSKADPHKIMAVAKYLNISMGISKEVNRNNGFSKTLFRNPFHYHNNEKIKSTKILIGYNSMEHLYKYAQNVTPAFYKELGDVFYLMVNETFHIKPTQIEAITRIVKKFYLGDKKYGPESMIELAKASSDFYINNPIERSVNNYMKANTVVFKYLFSYTGASTYKNISGAGASYREDLKFLFDLPTPLVNSEQNNLKLKMIKLWANFVKFGNPTPEDGFWKPVAGKTRPYLDINLNQTMRNQVFQERNAFWDLFWHGYYSHTKTYY